MRFQGPALATALMLATVSGTETARGAEWVAREAVPIEHLSGGIGEDEQERLAAREKEFNLKLVFSLVQGNYVAGVDVMVTDARGRKILERRSEGPIFLARLPAGRYQVMASYGRTALGRSLGVGGNRLRTEYFRWPADPNEDLPVSRWLDPD